MFYAENMKLGQMAGDKTFTINGHTVTAVNCCTVQTREPNARELLKIWPREKIRAYLEAMPEGKREAFRKELNKIRK